MKLELLQPDSIQVRAKCFTSFVRLLAPVNSNAGSTVISKTGTSCKQAVAEEVLQSGPTGIDHLMNNAGILGTYSKVEEQ